MTVRLALQVQMVLLEQLVQMAKMEIPHTKWQ
jgi:hypothetical protein